jgi:uncharacterized protein YneF (UPF0154 family)
MNELIIIAVVSLVGGAVLGAWMTRLMLREIGVPPDERAREIGKMAALRTWELVLIVDVVMLYYNWLIAKDQVAVNTAIVILITTVFGGWFFRWYYARRM